MRSKIIKFNITIVLIISLLTAFIQQMKAATSGVLDATFSGDGKLITNFTAFDDADDVAIQPDGKIVVAGTTNPSSGAVVDFIVLRYNANGTLDNTFGGGGVITTDFSSSIDSAFAVALQSDGKILVAGESRSTASGAKSDFALARYNANGTPDTTFDTDGKVTTDFAADNDSVRDLAIQSDGKIVAGGFTTSAAALNDFAIARYNTNGSLDTTFDTDGKVTTDFTLNETCNAVAIQTDGKIIAAGGGPDVRLARYNTNGSLDSSFGGTGKVSTTFGGNDNAGAMALQADGKIVIAGSSQISTHQFILGRYTASGSLDTTFDTDGKAFIDFDPNLDEIASDMRIQPDGKIIVAGFAELSATNSVFALVRCNSNGSLDNGFGNGGKSLTDFTDGNDFARGIALQVDGKIVAIGNANENDIGVARYLPNGQPSASGDFDGDGFTDYVVFRPNTATWFVLRSLDNTLQIVTFGVNGDVPLDGDFDGDGRNDFAIYRPSVGEWWVNRSSTRITFAVQFGTSADKAVPGDYDKDGSTDIGLFRPSTGEWLILRSSTNFSTFFGFPFGSNGDIPVTRQGL